MGCGGAGLVGGCGAGLAATNSFRFMLHPTTKNGRRLPLTLGGECDADGCRLGSDCRGDLARYGRPAWRAALAGRRGRALFAGSHHPIIRIRSHFVNGANGAAH